MDTKKYLDTQFIFHTVIEFLFKIILIFLIIVLGAAAVKLFFSLGELIAAKSITGSYKNLFSDIFTLYILIEIVRSLVEYFRTHRLRLTFIVDAVIVFVLRDVMIMLYMKDINTGQLYALSTLLLVLGAIRIASIIVFRQEVLMASKMSKEVKEL